MISAQPVFASLLGSSAKQVNADGPWQQEGEIGVIRKRSVGPRLIPGKMRRSPGLLNRREMK